MEEIQHYAVIVRGRAPNDPSGLARRVMHGDEIIDQSLRRDLSWTPTTAIVEWEYGEELMHDLRKISKTEADELIEQFREKWSREG